MPDRATIVAQLSDPHVRVGRGDRPASRSLAAAVGAIGALDPTPDAVIVSGDLVEHGDAREYVRVRELLAPLRMPCHVLPGNHDDRDALRAHFPVPADPNSEFVQYAVGCGALRLLVCDTTVPGRDDGRLGIDRLGWLEVELATDLLTPTILAMHHPPILTGIGALDDIGLAPPDRAALGELVGRSPHLARIVAGHVHRTVAATLSGCGVLTCPSTYLQALLDIRPDSVLELIPEPAGFAVHVWLADGIASHVQPVDE